MSKQIVILGAGYAGLLSALSVREYYKKDEVQVTVVNQFPTHQIITELHRLAGRASKDDIPEAAMSVPPLTTIAADPRARGREAAALVLSRLEDRDTTRVKTIAPVRLVVRDSCCPPPNA